MPDLFSLLSSTLVQRSEETTIVEELPVHSRRLGGPFRTASAVSVTLVSALAQ
jgi:hypothetical protein